MAEKPIPISRVRALSSFIGVLLLVAVGFMLAPFVADGVQWARRLGLVLLLAAGTVAWLAWQVSLRDSDALARAERERAEEAIRQERERAEAAIAKERAYAEERTAEMERERDARESAEKRHREMQRWAMEMRSHIQKMSAARGPLGETNDVPAMILRIALELLEAEKGLLLSRADGDGDGGLDLLAYEGFEADPAKSHVAQRFAKAVIRKDETIRENSLDIPESDRTAADHELDNLVAIPIFVQDEFIGVLIAANKEGGFEEHEDEVLLALGDHAGALLQNTRLRGDLRTSYLATIRILANALEAKDPFLRGHSNEVSTYVSAVAAHFDLDDRKREELVFASLLHDLGKIGISERILLKPASLSPEEFNIIKLHPRIGYRLVEQVPSLTGIAKAILYHHERWDGLGYPDGLRAEEIPIEARVVAVADAFSAMTSDRPYRGRRPLEEALAELERGAGTQFDPEVVRVFCEELRKRPPVEARKSELAVALSDPQLEVRISEDEPVLGYGPHAVVDNLTLLYSHRYLHEMARAEGERATVQGSPFSVVLAEVADIAQINEREGYAAGDAAIRKLAHAVQRIAVTCGGTAARYGGPRIALLIPKANVQDAERCARELEASIEDGLKVRVAVAVWNEGNSGNEAVIRARRALEQISLPS